MTDGKNLDIFVKVEVGSTTHKTGITMSADTIMKTKADFIKVMLNQIERELQKAIPKMLGIEGIKGE